MRLISFLAALLLLAAFSLASAQVEKKSGESAIVQAVVQPRETDDKEKVLGLSEADEPQTWLYLVGGRAMRVDEATQKGDDIWFRVGNVTTLIDRKRVERTVRETNRKQAATAERLRASGSWKISDSARIENYFLTRFGRRLPLTAFGQSALHTRWGYDHRQGIDVGLHPDSPEGRGLIEFLRREDIPFLAFREAVRGVATGPHIHVGNPSHRLQSDR